MGCLDGNNRWFSFLVTLSQIAGITAVVLVGVWMGNFQGGFGWGYKNPHKFNYHPLFMVLGMVFLYGDGKPLRSFTSTTSDDADVTSQLVCTLS